MLPVLAGRIGAYDKLGEEWLRSFAFTAACAAVDAAAPIVQRQVLLSLAAEFDRKATETFAEATAHATNGDDDAALMASGASDAWRGAAARASARARSASSGRNEAAPVSREGQSASGESGTAESLTDYGPAIDAAVAKAGTLNIGRGSIDSPEIIGRLIAAEVLRVATPTIAAAERERLYAELGNDHYVIFTEDGWTTEHSVECRLSGHMHSCAWHEAVKRIATGCDPDMLGRWKITGISEGLPDLERADREGT
jgi:hypothetical protein